MEDNKNLGGDDSLKDPTPRAVNKDVVFTPEQMSVIQNMMEQARKQGDSRRPDAISMYNMRDITKIETVNVKRIDGKFVMAFKNWQKDKFKTKPVWLQYELDNSRGGPASREPFITLILQEDENSPVVEQKMLLVDYVTMGKRDQYQAKVVDIKMEEIIEDWGVLGQRGEYAGAIDDKGNLESVPKILAQTKREERVFFVELPGFSKPVSFISDFLA